MISLESAKQIVVDFLQAENKLICPITKEIMISNFYYHEKIINILTYNNK